MSSAETWQRLSEDLLVAAPGLSPLGAGLLAALALGLARDSRGFARDAGLPHALVLRDATLLAEAGLIRCTPLSASRLSLVLTARSDALIAALPPDGDGPAPWPQTVLSRP